MNEKCPENVANKNFPNTIEFTMKSEFFTFFNKK